MTMLLLISPWILGMMLIIVVSAGRTELLHTLLESNRSGVLYDNRVPPNYEDDYPTNVTVQLYVLSIDSVTEAAMVITPAGIATASYFRSPTPPSPPPEPQTVRASSRRHSNRRNNAWRRGGSGVRRNHGFEYSLSIFLRQNWTDKRLEWDDDSIEGHLEVDPKYMNLVWTPDLYFVNEKEATMHDVTVSNKLLHIHRNGSMNSSMRISMTLSCDMYLERYPHDEQICSIAIGSYSYSSENVAFQWHIRPVVMREGLTLPRFTVEFHGASDCFFLLGEDSLIFGNYTCIQADFKLRREFGYYIAQVYVPSILIVVLSWVSFWIDMDATPARVSLGLLTVLAMTTQSTGEKAALPKVSYVKAIDIWMSVCLVFVFAALLEFAYVNVQSRVEKRRRESVMVGNNVKTTATNMDTMHPEVENGPEISRRFVFLRDRAKVQKARFVDKCSRYVFPFVFILFNCAYWLYYRR